MRRVPLQNSQFRLAYQRILYPGTPEFGISGLINVILNPTSSSWPGVNDPIGYKFRLSYPGVVDQLGVCNGSAAGGNFDVGIYDESFARLVSTGSTAGSGNNLWQWVNVADTSLLADKIYWLFVVRDNTTANRSRQLGDAASAQLSNMCGAGGSTTDAFPLPDPITNIGNPPATGFHLAGVALKAPY